MTARGSGPPRVRVRHHGQSRIASAFSNFVSILPTSPQAAGDGFRAFGDRFGTAQVTMVLVAPTPQRKLPVAPAFDRLCGM